MNPNAFKQLRTLFDLVSELPAHEQEAALRQASNDEAIITQVLNMVRRDTAGNTHLSTPIMSIFSDVAAPELDVGATLGNWRLIQLIGSGGMGGVFLAERSDGHFSQKAAVKILRGIPTAHAAALIAQERQVLAGLEHPNIARLLDGGATPGGRPYLVMEYVDGVALDVYAKALTIKRLLHLFLTICEAVAFAHRRLVVHCDLKPSNILVNVEGQVKLLDFGISRIISAESEAADVDNKNLAFTPRYASPEQKSGGVISTATDIYSLGEIFNELLVAIRIKPHVSFNLRNDDNLPDELQAIVACAKANNVADRYATVDDFAADIRRYTLREPVKAHAQTLVYLSHTLLRRRWPWFLAASVVAVTLGASAWRVLLERNSAIEANTSAERERAVAVSARDSAEAALKDAARERDRAILAEAGASAASKLAEAGRRLASAAEARALSARDNATSAEARAVLARDAATSAAASSKKVNQFLVSIFDGINPARAGGSREASARDVVAMAEKKLDDLKDVSAPDRADLFSALASVHTSLGANADAERYNVRTAAALAEIGEPAVARRAIVLANISKTRLRRGEGDALTPASEALAIADATYGALSIQAGRALLAQASALRTLQRSEEEQISRARAKAIFDKIPLTIESVIDVNLFWTSHAAMLHDRGNFTEAETAYRRVLDAMARFPGPYQDDKFNVFLIQRSLANTLYALSRYAESEALLVSAYQQCVALNGMVSQQCLNIDAAYAFVLVGQRKFQEAIPVQMRRLANTATLEGKDSILYASALSEYANTLLRADSSNNLVTGESMLREALAIANKLEINTAAKRSTISVMLMEHLRQQKRFDEALVFANDILALVKDYAPLTSDIVLRATIRVAQHEQLLDQHSAADARIKTLFPLIDKMTPTTKFNFQEIRLRSLKNANAPASDILAAHREALVAATLAFGVNSVTAKRFNVEIEKLTVASVAK